MGSNYLTVEGSPMNSSNSPDSLNGLKFGQKIYFEDVGIGASTKSSNGSSSSSSSSSQPKKSGKGLLQNGQPPRCQVEGCKLDLSDAKTYYSRHKVCAMHSKSPKVVVAGIEQRFCQQCSRFHQLSEFDQGKRSCRRRLAGHNERRRKPPPGSLLSSRLGRLSSSLFSGNTSRNGGILLDFSSYSRNSGKGPWPDTKPHEPGSHSTFNGKYLHNMWPAGNTGDPPEMFLQGSVGLSSFPIPPGECITGGVSSDSSCALSLLSNQTWGSRNRASGIELGNLMNLDGAAMSQCTGAHTVTVAPIPSSSSGNSSSSSWGFKTHDSNAGLQMMPPDHLGLGQISVSQAHGGQFPSDLFIDQVHDGGRQYMEVDHSKTYNSVTNSHVHWSLS